MGIIAAGETSFGFYERRSARETQKHAFVFPSRGARNRYTVGLQITK